MGAQLNRAKAQTSVYVLPAVIRESDASMSAAGDDRCWPSFTSAAFGRHGSYLGDTGRDPTVIAKAARDPDIVP